MARLHVILTIACIAACKRSAPSCGEVWDHIVTMAPRDAQPLMASKRDREVATCEASISTDERRCAMEARDLDELQACRVTR